MSDDDGADGPEHLPPPEVMGEEPAGGPQGFVANDRGATIALAAGVVAIVFTILLPSPLAVIAGPLAVFMGWRSMKRIDASEGTLGGRKRAKAGFITGIVGTLLLAALLVWFLLTFEWPKDAPEDIPAKEATTQTTTTQPG